MELGNYTGVQADIFATGVILFIMYNGTPPFLSTKPHDRIYKLIKDKNFQKFWALHERNKKPGFYPDSFKRLISSFLSADPDRRPTFESLENDEWMKGDEFMGNDLFDYMRGKAEKLFEKDENKQKMAAIKKDLYMKKGNFDSIQPWKKKSAVSNPTEDNKLRTFLLNSSLPLTTRALRISNLKI